MMAPKRTKHDTLGATVEVLTYGARNPSAILNLWCSGGKVPENSGTARLDIEQAKWLRDQLSIWIMECESA